MRDRQDVARQVRYRIGPSRGRTGLDAKELWRARDLILLLAERDLKLRYRQTALGVVWVVLGPLLSAGIFTFVFGHVANLPSEGAPYFAFVFSGTLAFGLFGGTATRASGSLTGNRELVSKVYFHRLALPLATILSVAVDMLVGLVVLGCLMVGYGVHLSWAIMSFPLWVVLLIGLGLAVGVFFGAATVRFRDLSAITTLIVQLALYASPVAYSATSVPKSSWFLYSLNPLVGGIEALRWSTLHTGRFPLGSVVYSTAAVITLLPLAVIVFRRIERTFADVI